MGETTFHMKPLKFQVEEEAFHTEVCSCPGAEMKVRSEVPYYSFEKMLPKSLPRETPEEAAQRISQLQLRPLLNQLDTWVKGFNLVIETLTSTSTLFPNFSQF